MRIEEKPGVGSLRTSRPAFVVTSMDDFRAIAARIRALFAKKQKKEPDPPCKPEPKQSE